MADNNTPNVCQYWSPLEPKVCANWDGICTFKGDDGEKAEFYPYCNVIGTQSICGQYDAEGTKSRCILPDVNRHVVDRLSQDGSKWVVIPEGGEGDPVALTDTDYIRITKYNDGHCIFGKGDGTSVLCSAFSPYHLGFSTIQPDDKDATLGYDQDGFTTGSGLTYRLPLGYEIFNERPQLSKCRWWEGSPEYFSVTSGTGGINPIGFKCDHPDTEYVTNTFGTHRFDEIERVYVAPCNGAKPECQYYTGVCWKYCVDEKMRQGDKVLAEQILELRWYLRRNRWDAVKFKNAFKDLGYIYGWEGSVQLRYESGLVTNWSIPSTRAYISDFDTFEIEREPLRLTAGTPDQTAFPDYPTLVEELKALPLRPIIRNKFYKDPNNENISTFEAATLDHDSILLVGDIFYSSPTYAINLSDPDLEFLKQEFGDIIWKQTGSDNADELLRAVNDGTAEFSGEDAYYDGMAEVEAAYKIPAEFNRVYDRIDTAIKRALKYWPEKVAVSETGFTHDMFYIGVPTFWGENIIIVLNEGGGGWDFDLLRLNKLFCGGVVAQTAFLLQGDAGKTIDYLPAYEQDFFAHTNNNGIINFKFAAFGNEAGQSAEVSYVYNDYAYQIPYANPAFPPENETFHFGYKLYKVKLDIPDDKVTEEHIRFFGNGGYAIVEIPDSDDKLSSVFGEWEIDGKLNLNITDADGSEKTIEMEVVEKCTDRLETNQMIIKPKNLAEFSQPCEPRLSFKGIYYYEKRSFDETPDDEHEEVTPSYVGEDDTVVHVNSASIHGSGNAYSLTEFGRYTLLISVVYRGKITGKIKGLTRTKMITWVRQPYCRDVEISYSWASDYRHYQILGANEDVCWGKKNQKHFPNTVEGYTPPCGDHDLSVFNGKGPMWYPYDACDEIAVYPIDQLTSRVTALVNRPMEIFIPTLMKLYGEEVNHGSHDMRMLGPQDYFGEVCGVHASIWACTCDWSYCNKDKIGENRFTGGGRYRCDLDDEAKLKATRFDGELPKFGNPVRDFIRSFRSIDNAFYYAVQGSSILRRQKWMPMYYFYTAADVTARMGSEYPYPYDLYTKDVNSPFVHPMGLYLAEGGIEGVSISEKIDVDDDNKPKRYSFEEVFRTSPPGNIMYPQPTNIQFSGSSPVLSWYTYKDYPGGTDKSIQWAWQEIWRPIERDKPSTEIMLGEDSYGYDAEEYSNEGSSSVEDSTDVEENIVIRPFELNEAEVAEGIFLFCDVEYPPYQYDARITEHMLVVEEDYYTLVLTTPVRDEGGEYENKNFYLTMINNDGEAGPTRSFNADGSWDSDGDDEDYDLYTTCTQDPWLEYVTLFGPGYDNISIGQAETDGRMILTYDDVGDEVKNYYQRGLNISLDAGKFIYLPREKNKMDSTAYEVEFSKAPSYLENEDNPLGAIVPGEAVPTPHCWEIGYINLDNTVDFIFHFDNKGEKRAVDRIVLICKYGSEELEEDEDGNARWRLFHLPAVEIAHSDAGIIYDTMFTTDSMSVATNADDLTEKKVTIDYNLNATDIIDPHDKWRLRIRVKPTTREINRAGISEYYDEGENVVFIKCIYVYDTQFIDAEEPINTWERLYNISYGEHGNFPPHGYESTGSLLYPAVHEVSTIYQRDSFSVGVVGLPGTYGEQETMNKIRGRLMFETHQDKEPLPVDTLERMEEEQKEIYDAIAVKEGSTGFSLKAVIPPGLSDRLEEASATYPELWSCEFLNSIVLPLTSVAQYEPYSAAGQQWKYDFSDYHLEPRCAGSQFGVFTVGAKSVYDYVLVSRYSPSVSWNPEQAIDVYFQGIGKVLADSWSYLKSQFTGGEEVSERLRTDTGYSNPGPITPY